MGQEKKEPSFLREDFLRYRGPWGFHPPVNVQKEDGYDWIRMGLDQGGLFFLEKIIGVDRGRKDYRS